MSELAKRAVAAKGWSGWLLGMAYVHPLGPDPSGGVVRGRYRGGPLSPRAVPDLADPLTVQALLLLVRDAWREPFIGLASQDGKTWEVVRPCPYHPENIGHAIGEFIEGETEAEALVVALEFAP